MHVGLRVDGGSEIGYGHLIRTGALASELLECGNTLTVATTTPVPANEVFPTVVDVIELPSRADPDPFVKWLGTAAPDVVFTDAYPVDTAYQQAVREHVPLVVLQDDARHAVCADAFTNGNLYASDLDYEFVGKPPKRCLGPDYVLLRPEIRKRATEEPSWRESPEHAIIVMGGSDIAELTPSVVHAFDGFDLTVDAIVGPGCSHTQEQAVRSAASESSTDIRVSRDPDDLVDRMVAADFAVSTASSTTYEFLALGTPLITIPIVDNQEPIAAALRRRDVATVLERGDSTESFRSAIQEYLRDAELRRKRQMDGRTLIDGAGTERIAAIISDISEQ